MAKVALTDPTVKNLPLPAKGQKSYWDATVTGFGIRISQGGAKTWVVVDPRSKTRAQETIGRYPLISLSDARSEARRRLAENTLGKHKARSKAWKMAVAEYLAEVKPKVRHKTYYEYKRVLERHFKFGATLVSDVTPQDIQKKLDKLADTPTEQRHAFGTLQTFIGWAHRRHYLNENPMGRMEAPKIYKSRERILSDDELKKVWAACPDDVFGRIVKLLILTGQRKGETSKIEEPMWEGDRVTLPSTLTKNGRTHTFPVGPLAQSFLKFPLTYNGFGKAKARLDAASGVKDWTLHDLRRTFASGLAAQGVALPVIEKLLNHVSGSFRGIVGVYQRYDFFPEMKDAIERWEAYVLNLTSTSSSDLATIYSPPAASNVSLKAS